MLVNILKNAFLANLCLVFTVGCSLERKPIATTLASKRLSPCHIVYDAGSSGTRLYVYEQQDGNWVEHKGPKSPALADPVRGIGGKNFQDVDAVVDEIVSSLNAIKHDGLVDGRGKPKWAAFDWGKQCHVVSAKVYATAGMRMAEQENLEGSTDLWKKLKQKLVATLGDSVEVKTRTLSGYEEGLYAWLSVKEKTNTSKFGIVEMGGASSQVTFPCPQCNENNDAIRTVMVNGEPLKIYSYSFLGLGQDEAPKILGLSPSCSYGVGTMQKIWKANMCAEKILIADKQRIRDPYNFRNHARDSYNHVPISLADVNSWVLTGAYNFSSKKDINTCCFTKGKCYKEGTSCFRSIYLKKYLNSLNVPSSAQKMNTSWTQGAVICDQENCLQRAHAPRRPIKVLHRSRKTRHFNALAHISQRRICSADGNPVTY